MLNPFQCVHFCLRCHPKLPLIVLAASGSSIYSFDSSNGALLSVWPERASTGARAKADTSGPSDIISERPGKRRKLSAAASSESSSAEIVVENGKKSKKRSKGKFMGGGIPAVIKLIGSSDGRRAVAVTGEDKCIRVFDILDDGSIEQMSERAMPKRPCSITLNTDEDSIMCGDKFGDVYVLPLREIPNEADSSSIVAQPMEGRTAPTEKKFVPAANNLTIHTQTNQRALLNQQNAANKRTEKKALSFTHQLLLGHVSLLTDLVYVALIELSESGSKRQDYIITADRDEHIRVSRGPPQSHIIESYCLGHTSFVSKLCVPKWKESILISGGGDSFLLLWDWAVGLALQKIEIATLLDVHRPPKNTVSTDAKTRISPYATSDNGIAISGLWAVETQSQDLSSSRGDILVACEGVPVLLVLSVTPESRLEYRDYLQFQGNVLDLTYDPHTGVLLVSLDDAHLPWSTDQLREERSDALLASCHYSTRSRKWVVAEQNELTTAINLWAGKAESVDITQSSQKQNLSDMLYGIENLRKRGDDT